MSDTEPAAVSVEEPAAEPVVTAWRAIAASHAAACAALEREMGKRHGLGVSEFEVLDRLAESGRSDFRSQELAEAGVAAEDLLRKALDKEVSAEVKMRARELLERIAKNGVAPERLRSLRAIEVLERIGNNDARQMLEGLAKGDPDARLTQDARAELERLRKLQADKPN